MSEVQEVTREEIRGLLLPIRYLGSRILEHERMKEALFGLGIEKGFIAQEEMNVDKGRIDLCWLDPTGKVRAAFEIDSLQPKEKSLAKLRNLECEHKFIILRKYSLPFGKIEDIVLIGLNKKSPYRYSLRRGKRKREVAREKER